MAGSRPIPEPQIGDKAELAECPGFRYVCSKGNIRARRCNSGKTASGLLGNAVIHEIARMPDQRHATLYHGVDLGIRQHIHMGEHRAAADQSVLCKIDERRLAEPFAISRIGGHEVLMLVEYPPLLSASCLASRISSTLALPSP